VRDRHDRRVRAGPRDRHGPARLGQALGHRRLWLVTTNDTIRPQRFYERSGFRLVAVREGEIERSRRLKPQIPDVGEAGVPIRDELEYEFIG
jgi:hypothetical protein